MKELIFPAALFLAVIILGGIYMSQSMGMGIIEANACRVTTCKALVEDHTGMGQIAESGRFFVVSDEVIGVSEIHNCAECSKVTTRDKQMFFVMGKPDDVACRVWGGTYCKQGER